MNLDSIKQLVQDVNSGNENPLKAYGLIKQQIDELGICLKEVKEEAVLEALRQDNKTFTNSGFKFTLGEGKASYNYKKIKAWAKAKKALDKIQATAKTAYSAYKSGLQTADGDGEVSELPIVTYSAESLSAKFVGEE